MTDRFDASWVAAILLLISAAAVSWWPAGPTAGRAIDVPSAREYVMPEAGEWIEEVAGQTGLTRRPQAETAPAEATLTGYTLTGVVETDGEMWALVEIGGESRSYRTGAIIDGFRLVQIEPERVIFERDGSEVVLRLAR